MADLPVIARLPVSWLRRTSADSISIIRKVLLPASWLLQRYYGGVWISGEVQLTEQELLFMPGKMNQRYRAAIAWKLSLAEITDATLKPGRMLETIDIKHGAGASQVFKTVRSAEFFAQLQALRAKVPSAASSDA